MSDLYREQDVRELCSICDETVLAVSSCLRCGTPLCAEHRHDDDKRCARCENEYADGLEVFALVKDPDRFVNLIANFSVLMAVCLGVCGVGSGAAEMAKDNEGGLYLGVAVTVIGLVQLIAVLVWRSRLPSGEARAHEQFEQQRRTARQAFLAERLEGARVLVVNKKEKSPQK